ncbi:MAG: hypothetical protein B7Z55_04835 [Planctomycetales bacterium 12-60-4]|nr:MAG: hypothetical protein B7Z55_04835 [Planctomycetales bacterium 12-60-4]
MQGLEADLGHVGAVENKVLRRNAKIGGDGGDVRMHAGWEAGRMARRTVKQRIFLPVIRKESAPAHLSRRETRERRHQRLFGVL